MSRKYDEYDYKTAMEEVMATSGIRVITSIELKQIEEIVDAYGIRTFLNVIQMICGEKAEHVAVNWQDTTTAKRWEDLAASLGKINSELEEM